MGHDKHLPRGSPPQQRPRRGRRVPGRRTWLRPSAAAAYGVRSAARTTPAARTHVWLCRAQRPRDGSQEHMGPRRQATRPGRHRVPSRMALRYARMHRGGSAAHNAWRRDTRECILAGRVATRPGRIAAPASAWRQQSSSCKAVCCGLPQFDRPSTFASAPSRYSAPGALAMSASQVAPSARRLAGSDFTTPCWRPASARLPPAAAASVFRSGRQRRGQARIAGGAQEADGPSAPNVARFTASCTRHSYSIELLQACRTRHRETFMIERQYLQQQCMGTTT